MAKPTGSARTPTACVTATQCVTVSPSEMEGNSVTGSDEDADSMGIARTTWRSEFLASLAETSNVTAAAAKAGVKPDRAYKTRRSEPGFAKAWREALCEGYDNLEMELLHRLRFGESRDGEAKFDNANALRLLTQHRETVARQRAIRENSDIKQVRASIHAKLLALRDQVLAQRKAEQEMTGAAHG